MRRLLTVMLVSLIVVVGSVSSAEATGDYDNLLKLVPSDANALVMINASGVMNTEYAKANRWAEQRKMKLADNSAMVPKGTERYIRAAQLDLRTQLPTWQVVAVAHDHSISADSIARAEGGHVDEIGGLEAAVSPRGFIALAFSDRVVGAISPASRQSALRWAQQIEPRNEPELSSFLTGVVDEADMDASQFVLAIDLEGVVSSRDIFPDIAGAKLVVDNNLDPVELAELIASIKGVTLTVAFTDKAVGTLTYTFGEEAAALQPIAKQAAINGLKNHGAYIGEAEDWEVSVEGNKLILTGELYSSGLRRITSLLEAPTPDTTPDDAEEAEPLTPEEATLQHYRAVEAIINDVSKAENAEQISEIATYLDRYAKKIENLPILNVDPELLAWSEYVSTELRGTSVRLKDVRLRTSARAAQHQNFYDTNDTGGAPTRTVATNSRYKNYDRSSYYSGSGRYYNNNNYRYSSGSNTELNEVDYAAERYRRKYQEGERRQVALEERASGLQEAMNSIKEIQNSMSQVRRDMTQKYQVEF